jgi:hypothetical protein
VQQAWSKGDIAALRRMATPEMLSYFSQQLAVNASTRVTDTITDVKLEQADLAEAWCEAEVNYVTVALRFSALDYTTAEDGRVIKGSTTAHNEATETWTFMRQSGGTYSEGALVCAARTSGVHTPRATTVSAILTQRGFGGGRAASGISKIARQQASR